MLLKPPKISEAVGIDPDGDRRPVGLSTCEFNIELAAAARDHGIERLAMRFVKRFDDHVHQFDPRGCGHRAAL